MKEVFYRADFSLPIPPLPGGTTPRPQPGSNPPTHFWKPVLPGYSGDNSTRNPAWTDAEKYTLRILESGGWGVTPTIKKPGGGRGVPDLRRRGGTPCPIIVRPDQGTRFSDRSHSGNEGSVDRSAGVGGLPPTPLLKKFRRGPPPRGDCPHPQRTRTSYTACHCPGEYDRTSCSESTIPPSSCIRAVCSPSADTSE